MERKPKQATRGQAQIYRENWQTIGYYSFASAVAVGIYLAVLFFTNGTLGWKAVTGFGFSIAAECIALLLMIISTKSVRGEKGNVVDAGTDLNDPHSFGEPLKDTIILSVIIQLLAAVSSYFLILLALFPVYGLYKLWVGVLGPWFFAPAPEEDPQADRKQRRRQQKIVYRR